MSNSNLAKPEVTEVAIIGLPVQSVKMSSMKASRYSQPDLKLLAQLPGCGAWLSQYSSQRLLSALPSQPSKPDIISKSFGTFRQSKLTNQIA